MELETGLLKEWQKIVHPLTAIFNRSLLTGKVPDSLKIAKVIPIHKKDDKEIFSYNVLPSGLSSVLLFKNT